MFGRSMILLMGKSPMTLWNNATSRVAWKGCGGTRTVLRSRHDSSESSINPLKGSKRMRLAVSAVALVAGATTSCICIKLSYAERLQRELSSISEDSLPLQYDGDRLEAYWKERPVLICTRLCKVLGVTAPFFMSVLWKGIRENVLGYVPPDEDARAAELRRLAIELREALVKLGPSFIKLGQVLSTRPDLLPATVLTELQQLCDAVPSFPTAHAIAVLEKELGAPVGSLFVDLDENSVPVAAASLGQVYRCKMISTTSEELVDVAVKIQRPGMITAVSMDLYVIRMVMHAVELLKGVLMDAGILAQRKQFNVTMFDSFAKASYFEVDYEHEASNQELFTEKLAAHGFANVYVPKVYREGTRRRVLTTEWIEGKQLSKSDPSVIKELVPVGVECFLAQLLDMGLFHGDPHAGNLLVNSRGELVLIDFGLCAVVDMPSTKVLTAGLIHLMRGNTSELVNDLIKLGFLPPDVDKAALVPVLDDIFTKARIARDSSHGFKFQSHMRGQQFTAVSSQLNSVFFDFPFVVPDYFALITRALIVLEGIAVIGDPEFDIFSASYPYAARRAVSMMFQ